MVLGLQGGWALQRMAPLKASALGPLPSRRSYLHSPPKKKKNKLQGRCGKKRLETGRALLTVQSWGIQAQGGPPILGCLACSWLIHPSFPARQFILEASTTVWQRKGITPGQGSLSPWLDSGESSSPQVGKERRATQTPDSQLGPPRGEGQPCPRQ